MENDPMLPISIQCSDYSETPQKKLTFRLLSVTFHINKKFIPNALGWNILAVNK